MLKEHLIGKSTSSQTLLEMIQYYITNSKSRLSAGTLKQYESIKRKMAIYLEQELLVPDFLLDKLNYRFINDYKVYLESKCMNSPNSIDRDVKRLKAVIHFAIKLDILKEDPFINYKSSTVPTHRSTLNMDEINKIESQVTSNSTIQIRIHHL